jgi:hypothetical protein
MHFVRTLSGLAVATLAFVLTPALADETPNVAHVMTTNGASIASGKRVAVQSFTQQDIVWQLVDFNWEPVGESAGNHTVEWRWYRDDVLVSDSTKKIDFRSTPYTVWTKRAAMSIGAGHMKIETIVDGTIVATSEVDVAAQ